jgi:capsular exopolysaccharide synthesis family protein
MIVHNKPKSPISEAYRSIRTNIQFANVDGEIKTIMFTSATKSEGKTTTISNIALTMADAGHRVLVLDCDFRNPSIHKSFGLTNKFGVTDILLKGVEYRNYVNKIKSYENLDVITVGKVPKNPSELLYSNAMKKFINRLKHDYDYIMIDTPPVIPVTDSAVMASYIDAIILVCASGVAEVENTRKAVESLKKVGGNIIGAVLNKAPIKQKDYHSYYHYGEIQNDTL